MSALAKPAKQPAARSGETPGGDSPYVIDVTEASFQTDVIEASQRTPIVLDFWAEWCEPCKQLSPRLEKLAAAAGGAWILAKIDVDANPGLAGMFGVQGIPLVIAVAGAQPLDAFSGVVSDEQLRTWLAAVLTAAARAGIGSAPPASETAPEIDARLVDGANLAQSGDFDAAAALFRQVLAESPTDDSAIAGLAQVELLRRTAAIDEAAALRNAGAVAAIPAAGLTGEALRAQLDAADVEFLAGNAAGAFDRLVAAVKASQGDDRESVRTRLLELFAIGAPDDPVVHKARRDLSSALF